MNRITRTALFAAVLSTSAAAAFAITPGSEEARTFAKAPVSLAQAIAAAEKQTGGKAAKAEFDHSKQYGWIYEVEVLSGDKTFEVVVDADKGAVLDTQEEMHDKSRRDRRDERRNDRRK